MARKFFTAEKLIESVKRRAMIPKNQVTFEDEDFLEFANEEMSLGLVPQILMYNEDYFLTELNIPLVSGQRAYDIPDRAIGNKLREVAYKSRSGQISEMTRIPVEDLSEWPDRQSSTTIHKYTVKNNQIILVPDIDSIADGSLVMFFYIRPNELVLNDRIGTITSINRVTGEIFMDKVPTSWTLLSDTFDMVQKNSPHKLLNYDITATGLNSATKSITLDPSQIPSNLATGDQMCLAGETNIIQVPSDLHVMLAHRVATRILESMGDLQNLQAANAKLVEMEQKTDYLINNRVEGSPMKVRNKHGFLRQSNRRKYKNN